MGGAEPWLMAYWKALVEFLQSVIERLFLSLTDQALQDKMCQNPLPSGVGMVIWRQDFRGKGSSPANHSKLIALQLCH